MLDNLVYLVTDTVLSLYLVLTVIQICMILAAKTKKHKNLWVITYVIIIGSILLALVLAMVYGAAPGLGHLADTFVSIGASALFSIMLKIASVVREHE